MDKFLIFAGDKSYPLGGFHDYQGQANSREEAIEKCVTITADWFQVVRVYELKTEDGVSLENEIVFKAERS